MGKKQVKEVEEENSSEEEKVHTKASKKKLSKDKKKKKDESSEEEIEEVVPKKSKRKSSTASYESEESQPKKKAKKDKKKKDKKDKNDSEESEEEIPEEKPKKSKGKSKKSKEPESDEEDEAPKKRKASDSSEPAPSKKHKKEESKADIESDFQHKVIVSNLPPDFTQKSLKKIFKKCGEFAFTVPHESQGFAVVKFKDESDVKKALKLNKALYKEKELLINTPDQLPAIQKRVEKISTIFVGNLNPTTTYEQVSSFFSGCGKVKSVRMSTDPEGKNKGFCHVDFTNSFAANLSLNLIGKKLNGKPLKIDLSADKRNNEAKPAQPST
ncbi:unnamed protein product [Blepharisma stoltei]|uniref:RRM domain-containing protein n=1 Tax=Blepharisma stoltei TaxID=1481888 RepID=A0AAU9KQ78_9CILI|nr:unnamed protein product [Blepharisma stoltei]